MSSRQGSPARGSLSEPTFFIRSAAGPGAGLPPAAHHPFGDQPQHLGAHRQADRMPVAPRAYGSWVGTEQMTEIAGDVTFVRSFDQAAEGGNVFRWHLDVLPARYRQDGNLDPGQNGGWVAGNEITEPLGIDLRALNAYDIS